MSTIGFTRRSAGSLFVLLAVSAATSPAGAEEATHRWSLTLRDGGRSPRCLEMRFVGDGYVGRYAGGVALGQPNGSKFTAAFIDGATAMISLRQDDGAYRALYTARLAGADRFAGVFIDNSRDSGKFEIDVSATNRCQPPRPAEAPTPPPVTPSPAQTTRSFDKEAGPIWSNTDAQEKCPRICAPPLRWEGQWRTTERGRMSVCGCVETLSPPPPVEAPPPPPSPPPSEVRFTQEAGATIGGEIEARRRCPVACRGFLWTGTWWPTGPSGMGGSLCECSTVPAPPPPPGGPLGPASRPR